MFFFDRFYNYSCYDLTDKTLFTLFFVLYLIGNKPDKPDFIGAPYEFWVGSNVGIGTSVGQIRINEAMNKNDVSYDLLHSYEEGGKL